MEFTSVYQVVFEIWRDERKYTGLDKIERKRFVYGSES